MNKIAILLQSILLAGLAVVTGCAGKKCASPDTTPLPVASSTAAVETKPKVTLPASASKPPAPFEGEGWRPMFDGKSFGDWHQTAFVGKGEPTLDSGVIILNMGDPFTGLNWTNPFPKINYEIALDAMRISGGDFFCGLTVPVGDSFCSLIVGGWGGSLVGISSIDGMDASENETTKYDSFDTGRWYRIRLRVTTDRIEAWIDDDMLVNVETTGKKLSVRAGEIELSEPLGICAWQTTAAVREIRFREVSGPASPRKRRSE